MHSTGPLIYSIENLPTFFPDLLVVRYMYRRYLKHFCFPHTKFNASICTLFQRLENSSLWKSVYIYLRIFTSTLTTETYLLQKCIITHNTINIIKTFLFDLTEIFPAAYGWIYLGNDEKTAQFWTGEMFKEILTLIQEEW